MKYPTNEQLGWGLVTFVLVTLAYYVNLMYKIVLL
jgi:hypothetical protein